MAPRAPVARASTVGLVLLGLAILGLVVISLSFARTRSRVRRAQTPHTGVDPASGDLVAAHGEEKP
jgi:hypothetical protein